MRTFVFLSMAGCSSGSRDGGGEGSADPSSDVADTDSDSDSDSDADSDADGDSDPGVTGDTGSIGGSCGDPALSYSSVSTPVHGQRLSVTSSLDLCLGVSATGWYSIALWDGPDLVCQEGWEISMAVQSEFLYPVWYYVDAAWHIEFSSLVQIDQDCLVYGYDPGSSRAPLDIAVDLSGSVWYWSDTYGWQQVYPTWYSEVTASFVDEGSSWDVDVDDVGLDYVVP